MKSPCLKTLKSLRMLCKKSQNRIKTKTKTHHELKLIIFITLLFLDL
ncbi:hypothetical protein FLJC2902T_07030 [Flavobacterium limnosediminis JC2902]|uniref:Uncharacterized protein n=1 Tax=Flavobacterium limnosediminis JC2902 TaxID=1341181 RepID=V6ST12_9FLAO|nr:hypothetical protein FLJC2902T_07030 [Flavobacterium limnosediminis JC2902]